MDQTLAVLLANAVARGVFPCASLEVGRADSVVADHRVGRLTFDVDAPLLAPSHRFDLASLTKVMATATVFMRLVDAKRVDLDAPLATHLTEWHRTDRAEVTVRDALAHQTGLAATAPLYRRARHLADVVTVLGGAPLVYAPHTRAIYSDLGFLLLGAVAERTTTTPWRRLADAALAPLRREGLTYLPSAQRGGATVPTGWDPYRKRQLNGEVHDTTAWALGGVATHAGLFGTAEDVGAFARAILRGLLRGEDTLARPATLAAFVAPVSTPGSSRALAWDTMRPTSSCGTRMSPRAIGHTGFTGTSLWIDPAHDLYIVLLTNRVCGRATSDDMQAVRREIHDTVLAHVT